MKTFDQRFLKQFRKGNQESFKILYNKYFDSLFLFGQKYIATQSVIEDIVQESFVKIWEKKASFFHEAAMRSFLYKTVRNSCLNYIEHQKVCKAYEASTNLCRGSSDCFLNHVIEEEVSRIIADTVQELPESARLIYLLGLNGLKNAEIAEDLHISIHTVKTQKQRARKFLKEKLKCLFNVFCIM